MSLLDTACFGTIEYVQSAVYRFPSGLPGFEDERAFVFLEQPNSDPLLFMHSLSNPNLCFILLPILAADSNYSLMIGPEELSELKLPSDRQPRIGDEILCAAVVSVGDGASAPTANLLAPIVVNLKEGIGMQVIQTQTEYSHRHPLVEEVPAC